MLYPIELRMHLGTLASRGTAVAAGATLMAAGPTPQQQICDMKMEGPQAPFDRPGWAAAWKRSNRWGGVIPALCLGRFRGSGLGRQTRSRSGPGIGIGRLSGGRWGRRGGWGGRRNRFSARGRCLRRGMFLALDIGFAAPALLVFVVLFAHMNLSSPLHSIEVEI